MLFIKDQIDLKNFFRMRIIELRAESRKAQEHKEDKLMIELIEETKETNIKLYHLVGVWFKSLD